MKLRPHHLLCTQSYEGMGYSEGFVAHMDAVTTRLREEKNLEIELVLSTDDICSHCPKMRAPGLCEENDTVLVCDHKVLAAFGLGEGVYQYAALVQAIRAEMTPAILEDICGECSWYPVSACRERLLGGDGAETANNK